VLDDGRLTDNKGRTVDFRNTIIIMTSNMGAFTIQERFSRALSERGEVSADIIEQTRNEVVEQLKQQLKPEFLNRIDEIVMFEPLTEKNILEIVDIQLGIIHKMLKQSGIELRVTDAARRWIAHVGYDAAYGARPVKRVIQREVINELSKRILAGKVDKSKPIVIDTSSDELSFSN
jgi:ATP-dependent Clp protease ATP-binding subunit ClpB